MLKGLLISAAVAALLSGFSTWKITHDIYQGKVARMTLGYAEAEKKALAAQAARIERDNATTLAAAVAEGQVQISILRHTSVLKLEVPKYVTIDRPCITWGFVRLHDAAVHGVSPDELPLAAGQSNDQCAPVDAIVLAQTIADNYGVARANAEQLNALAQVTAKLGR